MNYAQSSAQDTSETRVLENINDKIFNTIGLLSDVISTFHNVKERAIGPSPSVVIGKDPKPVISGTIHNLDDRVDLLNSMAHQLIDLAKDMGRIV